MRILIDEFPKNEEDCLFYKQGKCLLTFRNFNEVQEAINYKNLESVFNNCNSLNQCEFLKEYPTKSMQFIKTIVDTSKNTTKINKKEENKVVKTDRIKLIKIYMDTDINFKEGKVLAYKIHLWTYEKDDKIKMHEYCKWLTAKENKTFDFDTWINDILKEFSDKDYIYYIQEGKTRTFKLQTGEKL